MNIELIRRRLMSQGARDMPAGDADFPFPPAIDEPVLRDAAVLMPIVDHAQGLTLLLTQRAQGLRHHPGQVSFPGGRIEPDDADPVAAALRESHEEIGLAPEHVQVIGRLPTYRTGTGFRVSPVVAAVTPGLRWTLDAREVDAVFEVPLSFLLDRANWQLQSRLWQGAERRFHAMPFKDRYIWGATAGMIVMLADALAPAPVEETL